MLVSGPKGVIVKGGGGKEIKGEKTRPYSKKLFQPAAKREEGFPNAPRHGVKE